MTEKTKCSDDDNVIPHQRWLQQEKTRRAEIRKMFEMHRGVDDLMDQCLDDPAVTAERASKLLLTELGKMNAAPPGR